MPISLKSSAKNKFVSIIVACHFILFEKDFNGSKIRTNITNLHLTKLHTYVLQNYNERIFGYFKTKGPLKTVIFGQFKGLTRTIKGPPPPVSLKMYREKINWSNDLAT